MDNNILINSKKYEICTILRNLQRFKTKSPKLQNENIFNSIEKDIFYKDIILNILCLKDKRIGITTGYNINILIFNQHNFKIDMIIPIKALSIFQYLKDGNIIVSTIDNTFVILKINKNKYKILEEFHAKNFIPYKILELTNKQIISLNSSPKLEFFIKNDNKYSSFKILDLGYDKVEKAKNILEIPENRIVVFTYKYASLLVYDINTHKLLLKKYVNYNDIMSDLIDNKYIFVKTYEGMVVYNVDENFSETLYKNIPSPNALLKINMYEYLFLCSEEKEIYLMKFHDKKLIIKHKTTFNIAENFVIDRIHKLDEKKFIINITKLTKDNRFIGHFLVICKEI